MKKLILISLLNLIGCASILFIENNLSHDLTDLKEQFRLTTMDVDSLVKKYQNSSFHKDGSYSSNRMKSFLGKIQDDSLKSFLISYDTHWNYFTGYQSKLGDQVKGLEIAFSIRDQSSKMIWRISVLLMLTNLLMSLALFIKRDK